VRVMPTMKVLTKGVVLVLSMAVKTRGCGSYVSMVLSNCSYARVTSPNGKLESLWPLPADACPGDAALTTVDFGDGTEKGVGAYFMYTGASNRMIHQVSMDKDDHTEIASEVSVRATHDDSYVLRSLVQPRSAGMLYAIASPAPSPGSSALLAASPVNTSTSTSTTPELVLVANLTSLLGPSSHAESLVVSSDASEDSADRIFVVDVEQNKLHTLTITTTGGGDGLEVAAASVGLPSPLRDGRVAHVEFINARVGVLVLTNEPRQLYLLDPESAAATQIIADLPPTNETREASRVPQLGVLALASTFYYEDRGQLVSVLFPDQTTYSTASVLNPSDFATIYNEETMMVEDTDVVEKVSGNLGFQL